MLPRPTSNGMKKHLDSRSLGVEMLEGMFTSRKLFFQLGAVIATGLTAWVWFGIFSAQTTESMLYVLDIKQGDSQLIVLTGENRGPPVKILIDGGKDRMVLNALDAALGNLNNKYLDIVIMTHTDLDHMGGLVEVARRYGVGLFISNGRDASSDAYAALKEVFVERNIPSIVLLEGDAVRYGDSILSILSPNQALLQNKEVNEASLVAILRSKDVNALFTGDIGFPAENALLKKYRDLSADILKVGHHGSKYSSSENFIAAVRPLVSVIGVGKNNYGHPAPHVLETLELAGSRVYRTDKDGTLTQMCRLRPPPDPGDFFPVRLQGLRDDQAFGEKTEVRPHDFLNIAEKFVVQVESHDHDAGKGAAEAGQERGNFNGHLPFHDLQAEERPPSAGRGLAERLPDDRRRDSPAPFRAVKKPSPGIRDLEEVQIQALFNGAGDGGDELRALLFYGERQGRVPHHEERVGEDGFDAFLGQLADLVEDAQPLPAQFRFDGFGDGPGGPVGG